MGSRIRILPQRLAILIAALSEGTLNYEEMADLTGLHSRTVREYVGAFHSKGLVHIAAWDPNSLGRPAKPVYRWGKGEDAKRQSLTRAELARRYRKKQRTILNRRTDIDMLLAGVKQNATHEIPAS